MESPVTPADPRPMVLKVDGRTVEVPDEGVSLLEVLRDRLGMSVVKDGCSPQGQCGCCTVLVDGMPRVSCVTPARRVAGREITTLDGLEEPIRDKWLRAFTATGASQCGFCTPGMIVRLEGAAQSGADMADRGSVDKALAPHLCRCTGWQTIREAAAAAAGCNPPDPMGGRSVSSAERRAEIEGRRPQRVGVDVAAGSGGFADDSAPSDALVAVVGAGGGWAVGRTVAEARAISGKIQGRRSSEPPRPPIEAPAGDWAAVLRTSWVEPAYLELDASWSEPGGQAADPLANGGAFGGKESTEVTAAARQLADEHGQTVRVLYSREDTVRRGPKRPPVAGGVRPDGTGVLVAARTPGLADIVALLAPGIEVTEVDLPGPPTSLELRAAGWAETLILMSAICEPGGGPPPGLAAREGGSGASVEVGADGSVRVTAPGGGRAVASLSDEGSLRIEVDAGEPLDLVTLRSFVIGAAHQALSWVTSEGLAVDEDGEVRTLTIRSFGILKASDMPEVEVAVQSGSGEPVNASDAAFVAVAAVVWRRLGHPPDWPTGRLR